MEHHLALHNTNGPEQQNTRIDLRRHGLSLGAGNGADMSTLYKHGGLYPNVEKALLQND